MTFRQTAALQDWWEQERPKFDLVTSQLVIAEASAGDAAAVAERLKLLQDIPLIEIGSSAEKLAEKIITLHLMPQKAAADALHVAAAALAEVKYLLTCNSNILRMRMFCLKFMNCCAMKAAVSF